MQRFMRFQRTCGSFIAVLALLGAMFGITAAGPAYAATNTSFVALGNSVLSVPAGARPLGKHASNQQMTITLTLQSDKAAQMNGLLTQLYDPSSAMYHHWLKPGQFNRLFAPSSAQIASVTGYLKQDGLSIAPTPSPFLVRATGTTAQVEGALRTNIQDFVAANGQAFFQNTSAVQIPASLSNLVAAVSGLTDTGKLRPDFVTTRQAAKASGKSVPQYGAGPGGSGLTPSQTSSLYDANGVYALGNRGKGKGATLAVFELSGYTEADIPVYEQQFFGKSENVKIVNINVDGGPVTPVCPTGDICNPANDFSGDIEVEADIEQQIAIAPKINEVLVYNAPNDFTGITSTNEYFKIASDDLADSISSSWGLCEQDATLATAEAESVAFMQMAAQGQSMFTASGDSGAFDCLRSGPTSPSFTAVATHDPASQPFVTGVGGTSFSSFDPGSTQHPTYPAGFETVWNVLNQCSINNQIGGCLNQGAGGGGVSLFWARPPFQHGTGVTNQFSQKGPFCSLAANGQFCREVPDISANADEFTPYAEFCTGDPTTSSTCASFSGELNPPGWFGIGGTSLSSPVWSAVIALWDSVHGGQRFGEANVGLYQLFRSNHSYTRFFHDITGIHQTENNNGLFPTTPNYDLATGIGTPRITGIAEHNF